MHMSQCIKILNSYFLLLFVIKYEQHFHTFSMQMVLNVLAYKDYVVCVCIYFPCNKIILILQCLLKWNILHAIRAFKISWQKCQDKLSEEK